MVVFAPALRVEKTSGIDDWLKVPFISSVPVLDVSLSSMGAALADAHRKKMITNTPQTMLLLRQVWMTSNISFVTRVELEITLSMMYQPALNLLVGVSSSDSMPLALDSSDSFRFVSF